MNAREAIASGRLRLEQGPEDRKSDTPALDAEVLLRHVLQVDRAALYAHPEHALTAEQVERYQGLVRRRSAGEPVAYLVGRREFMGLDFAVDGRVLIPRPETEVLVERALEVAAAWRGDGQHGSRPRAVDVGAGSGAVAVSLAHYAPWLYVVATETSAPALDVAVANTRRLAERRAAVRFVRCSLLSAFRRPFDLITANLPYIASESIAHLAPTVRDYEPLAALDGGPDGLDLYRALLAQAKERLAPGGTLLMECDPHQAASLLEAATGVLGVGAGTVHRDLGKTERVVEIKR